MKYATNLHKQKLPGIRSIRKHPSIDKEVFKTYGPMFLQKYFLDDGKGVKMVAFGAKSPSFSKTDLFILFDLKLQPALFFEFKNDFDEEGFLKFLGKLISTSKFKTPKRRVGEHVNIPTYLKEKMDNDDKAILIIKAVMSSILALSSIILLVRYYFTIVKHAAEEYYVNTTIEKELNQELFSGQEKQESGFAMFSNLESYINMILDKRLNALIICGPPGMSKTYMVRRTLHFANKEPGKHYRIEKGSSLGLNSTYQLLYDNRTKLLILDDFDTPLNDPDIVNLLKAITDSYGKRIVSLSPDKKISTQTQATSTAPRKFEFKGQIILITNLDKNKIDIALRSRAPVAEVTYNAKQVIAATEKLLKFIAPKVPMVFKEEVFNYIKLLYKNDNKITVNFRSIKSSIDARVGNLNGWKEMVKIIVDYKGKPVKEVKAINRSYLDALKETV